MCGIAGIIHRDAESDVGSEMTRMLQAMKHRGPDSTGYALFGPPSDLVVIRFKLADANDPRDFDFRERLERHRNEVESRLGKIGAHVDRVETETEYAYRAVVRYDGDLKALADYVEDVPGCEVLSIGHSLEIVKDLGDANEVAQMYDLASFRGTHAIGHARMATESDVDISGAHPYWAYPFSDVAVVHNGQLTNYFQWKRRLEASGHRFQSECDSEIIAVYLAERMADGDSLEDAMHRSLDELDGVFTYMAVTDDSLGVAKDEMAAKPLVLYESEDLVAMASEEIAIRAVLDREIDTHDPYEGQVLVWEQVAVGGRRITYDVRGLAEPDAVAPRTATIEDGRATFDAADLSTRQINLELRRLIYEDGIRDVTVRNPGAKHSIGVGILQRCRITFEGSLGYFGVGLIDGPEVMITGRVGWSVAENMMSGVVVIEKVAGSLAGAAIRGGDLVVKGSVGARTGIDQKGGTIVVGGDAGTMTAFMMQRGRQIICGDVGPGLGDSMYDGEIFVGGAVKSLGIDCVEAEMTADDDAMIDRKFALYGLDRPDAFRKYVCGKVLYNYDNLEPSEKKLVIH